MKPLFYHIILFLLMLTASQGFSQQKLYSFSLKETGQFLTRSQSILAMADAQTATNGFAQLFIVKRLSNGNVLITSAAKPELFLRRSGGNVILESYDNNNTAFEWRIQYSGYPYASLMEPGTVNALSWQSGSGFSMQNTAAALTDNDDPSGDHYRFNITNNVTNTF